MLTKVQFTQRISWSDKEIFSYFKFTDYIHFISRINFGTQGFARIHLQ
jgi:hypothetical protein